MESCQNRTHLQSILTQKVNLLLIRTVDEAYFIFSILLQRLAHTPSRPAMPHSVLELSSADLITVTGRQIGNQAWAAVPLFG